MACPESNKSGHFPVLQPLPSPSFTGSLTSVSLCSSHRHLTPLLGIYYLYTVKCGVDLHAEGKSTWRELVLWIETCNGNKESRIHLGSPWPSSHSWRRNYRVFSNMFGL
ncbi:uncharacterized protein LOC127424872 isoform X3 [Myxocyprinus asiaticus]|uniref:uncharacterized protein LOC127424872 isoform X3 n=1 Tax=Myxocyprinus asiaticus TaxID=70543 RepID=UPI0022235144|nr:uncharacterized protein LOC127424872 isoform X3 [Myxocyprinus asiaticus]